MHVVSAEQFDRHQIEDIFRRADYFRKLTTPAQRRKLTDLYKGRQICTVFFQPSTRTRLSFETAALKLGMGVVSTENARDHSSSTKGETIEDTIKVLDQYKYDAIVLRHYEVGASARAAAVSATPIINAGDGGGEHPTQALLDAYTIRKLHGRLNNLRVVIGGDLRYGRTVRSLSHILAKYPGNHITFVSIPELQITADVKKILRQHAVGFAMSSEVNGAFKNADVVYWTRLQTENLKSKKLSNGGFVLDKKTIRGLPKKASILHPLPRVDEIAPELDNDPRAKYFEQVGNGLYVRMALLEFVVQALSS